MHCGIASAMKNAKRPTRVLVSRSVKENMASLVHDADCRVQLRNLWIQKAFGTGFRFITRAFASHIEQTKSATSD